MTSALQAIVGFVSIGSARAAAISTPAARRFRAETHEIVGDRRSAGDSLGRIEFDDCVALIDAVAFLDFDGDNLPVFDGLHDLDRARTA